jgi:hypothetical protein
MYYGAHGPDTMGLQEEYVRKTEVGEVGWGVDGGGGGECRGIGDPAA